MKRPFLLSAYGAAMTGASVIAPLALRARGEKEDAARRGERFGRASTARPEGRLVWLHGASVGETRVNLALAAALAKAHPDLGFLITTHTRTAAEIVRRAALPRAAHQFAPLDVPRIAARFLDHWRPDLAVFAESELWPNLIGAAAARDIPLALVNARMSLKSLRGWGRRHGSAAWLLSRFSWIGAADAQTASGLSALSGRAVPAVGNMKLDAPPPAHDPVALAKLQDWIGARPAWIAASTHEGEEAMVLEAHRALRHGAPEALLILVPRHPERGDAVESLARGAGFGVARRSQGAPVMAETGVYLADTIGEMGTLLRAAPVVLLGGSLVPDIGGHNPAEPVGAGAALLTGPYTHAFADVFEELESQGGALVVADEGGIARGVASLLFDPARRAQMRAAADGVLAGSGGATARTLAALSDLLNGRAA